MLSEFIDFVASVLPSVDPETEAAAKSVADQFELHSGRYAFTTTQLLPELSQGDVLSNVPFMYFDENGSLQSFKADAVIISTSCDIDHKDALLLAPVMPVNEVRIDHVAVEHNKVFEYMYLPDPCINDKYFFLGFISTIDINIIRKGIEEGKFERVLSLNQLGYYFLILKLTVMLFRKEDAETQKYRAKYSSGEI